MTDFSELTRSIRTCRLCADRFAKTRTEHSPRPVVWLSQTARILIIGQAPGARVHQSGRPFSDPSGDRLRAWMGLSKDQFYDQSRIAIQPMAFCFPGYDAKGSDLPPPALCADRWAQKARAAMPQIRLTLLVGGYAHRFYLGQGRVSETVAGWRDHLPNTIPLPHPSWRNTGWIKKNPWFTADVLPVLRDRIAQEFE